MSSREFDTLIRLLATRYHLIAPDFSGFGQSDAPPPSSYAYTFNNLATTTNAPLDQQGNSEGAPGFIQIANTWLIVYFGGGPTPDKPTVTLSVPADPDAVSSFMNIRVADIHACYELWRSRGAEFLTAPKDKYGETRCYIRDPDGYIIEVGQSKPGFAYG